jgi:hypothetical protein
MSEFDPPQPTSTAEDRLLARIYVQRVVFGSCALVMVLLFALGLAAYRQQQQARHAAELSADTVREVAADRATYARRLELELADARAAHDAATEDSRRALALAYARLAAADLLRGEPDRARDLIVQAASLGGPPWLGVLAYQLEEADDPPGTPLADFPAEPHGAGLIARDGAAQMVYAGGAWHGPFEALRVVPAGSDVARAFEGVIRAPWGERLPTQADDRLAAGFADGSLLVLRGVERAEWISNTGSSARDLPEPLEFEPVAIAGQGRAVLLRGESGLHHVAEHAIRLIGTADIAALSADGTRVALLGESQAEVFEPSDRDAAARLELSALPLAAALLYGGTVLVCAHADALEFLEVATGRVLWRARLNATALGGGADKRLHIVTADGVRVLELP